MLNWETIYSCVTSRKVRESKAITINPKIKFSSPIDLREFLREKFIGECFPFMMNSIELIEGVFELSKGGRSHFHGIIHLVDPIKFFKQTKKVIQNHVGFVDVKPLTCREGWLAYCAKQIPAREHPEVDPDSLGDRCCFAE